MDDQVVQRLLQEGGRDFCQQQPSTSAASSSSPSILQSLPLHVSFDHGYYLLVKSIQELRSKKDGVVTIGIGGPIGSGKSSLSEKVASVIGCTVMSMNFCTGVDDGRDLDSIDFDLLVQNLEVVTCGNVPRNHPSRKFLDAFTLVQICMSIGHGAPKLQLLLTVVSHRGSDLRRSMLSTFTSPISSLGSEHWSKLVTVHV